MKKIILIIIILVAGIALGIYFQKQPEAKKIETTIQTDANQAGADVKAGEQKVEAAAADVKAGVQKAEAVTTNVVGDVKTDAQKVDQAATNAVGEIKQKMP
jgi:uncharacterized protein YxeA